MHVEQLAILSLAEHCVAVCRVSGRRLFKLTRGKKNITVGTGTEHGTGMPILAFIRFSGRLLLSPCFSSVAMTLAKRLEGSLGGGSRFAVSHNRRCITHMGAPKSLRFTLKGCF